jgi:nucleoside-diphosphate-sugar epimerase
MRVFVTGAAGFIGSAVVPELISAGHSVIGLARSDANASALQKMGVEVHRGSLEDLDSLRAGARNADAVIHLAFIHDFSKFAENGQIDKRAIEAMGEVMEGSNKPLIVTGGVLMLAPGRAATEEDTPRTGPGVPRVSEEAALAFVDRGVKAMVVRLPQVHGGDGKAGLIEYFIAIAREKGFAGYIGDGSNRIAAAHRLDVARLYRLALENGVAGGRYHAVGEEGVSTREVAEVIARHLNVPARSIPQEEVGAYFGWLSMMTGADGRASSALTQKWLGWKPREIGLIADIGQPGYFGAA